MIVSKFYILYDTLFSRFWQVFLCRIMTFFHFSPIFHLLSEKFIGMLVLFFLFPGHNSRQIFSSPCPRKNFPSSILVFTRTAAAYSRLFRRLTISLRRRIFRKIPLRNRGHNRREWLREAPS